MRCLGLVFGLLSSVVLGGLASGAGCGGDDGGQGVGEGSGDGTSDPSADDGEAGSASAEGSGDEGGPAGGCCVDACPEGTMAGDACSGYNLPPPCCAGTEVFLCAEGGCGSQSCVGTWEASSCSDCDVSTQVYLARLGGASQCDPAGGADQCVANDRLTDACGCGVAVHVSADLGPVLEAYDAWVGQQCGPIGCGGGCQVGEPTCRAYDLDGETLGSCDLSG